MKNLLNLVIASKYKWFLICLLVGAVLIAIISSLITGSDMAEILLVGVLTSLLINLVSSFVTLVFIEERDRREMQQIELNRQSVVIGKLIGEIREYNNYYANLYKATSIGGIANLEFLKKNIYYDINDFAEHLNMIDFEKDSYALQSKANSHNKLRSWMELFIDVSHKYVKAMGSIQENYLFCLTDRDLIEPLSEIAGLKDAVCGTEIAAVIQHSPDMMMPKDSVKNMLFPDGVEMKFPYLILRTIDVVAYTIKLMNTIDRITQRKNFYISERLLSSAYILPLAGSGIDDKYMTHRKKTL